MLAKILLIIAISITLLLSQGESNFLAARYCLRPLARFEKGAPSFTIVNEKILKRYGIEPGQRTMLPAVHLDTRVANSNTTTVDLTPLQQEALGTLNGNREPPRHIEIPLESLPIELAEILAETQLLSLLRPGQTISAYALLGEYCDSVTLVPYIIYMDQAGNITQQNCVVNTDRKLYFAMSALRTPEYKLVKKSGEVSAKNKIIPVFIKIDGVYSLIEQAARLEALRAVGKKWQERAAAIMLLSSLDSMRDTLERLGIQNPPIIEVFIARKRALLIRTIQDANGALGVPVINYNLGYPTERMMTPTPRSVIGTPNAIRLVSSAI